MEPSAYAAMRAEEDTYWWYAGLRALVVAHARRALAGTPRPRVLDAGCGTGGAMRALAAALEEATLVGIDASPTAAAVTRERNVGGVVRASVEALPFADAAFDLVTCLDVLYIRGVDDRRALDECRRVLRPGGVVVVNVPAFEFLRGEHDAAVGTARRYTRSQVGALLGAAGFGTTALTYWNTTLLPAMAVWRRVGRRRARADAPRSDVRRLPGPLNRVLRGVIAIEVALARRVGLPLGGSVFAVGRRA